MSANFEWEDFITIEEQENSDEKEECLDIEEIMEIDPITLNTNTNLQYQNIMINYLSSYFNLKFIKTCEGDNNLMIDILKWLVSSSKFLANKIDQLLIEPPNGEIKRSSYQFCNESFYCDKFYNKNIITCDSHHYVHSLVYNDVLSIVNYLQKYDKLSENDKQNIKKSLDTIKFVIDHMYNEYTGLENYMSKAENYHKDNLNYTNKHKKRYSKINNLPKNNQRKVYV